VPNGSRVASQSTTSRSLDSALISASAEVSSTGATRMTTQVLAEAAREAAHALDVPDPIQRLLDLLDHADHGPEEEREADCAEHAALDVLDEPHHAVREFVGAIAERVEELAEQRLELLVVAEAPSAPRS
jgi:hypothetical protein